MTTEKDKAAPERVWLLSGPLPFNPKVALYAYQGDAPEPEAIEYIRSDLLATRVKEAREEAFRDGRQAIAAELLGQLDRITSTTAAFHLVKNLCKIELGQEPDSLGVKIG